MTLPIELLSFLIMTLSGSVGALFLKKGTLKLVGKKLFRIIFIRDIYIGVFLYLLGAAVNIYLLRFISYSVVYTMTSLTYVWTMIISHYFYNENITWNKIVSVLLIILGVSILNIP